MKSERTCGYNKLLNQKIGNEVLRCSITVNLSITAILLLLVSFALVMLDLESGT